MPKKLRPMRETSLAAISGVPRRRRGCFPLQGWPRRGPTRQFRAAAKLPEPQRCGILFSMTVTLSDIAKELNVSVVTVSKALRNKGKISVQTRRRVLKRAKELKI